MSFHKVDASMEDIIVRGAARIVYAPEVVPFPKKISDLIDLDTYDLKWGWHDLGSTKGGITITVSDQEADYKTIQQVNEGTIVAEMMRDVNITANLSDVNLNVINFILDGTVKDVFGNTWESVDLDVPVENLVATYINATYANSTYGEPVNPEGISLTKDKSYMNRIALLTLINGRIRVFMFRRALTLLSPAVFNFSKTGEQQSVAVKFHCYPDSSITDPLKRYFIIREQTNA